MVVIRLARQGTHKRPFYKVIVTDHRQRRDTGRYLERVGYYNPLRETPGQQDFTLDMDRINHWLAQGAQMSDTVKALVKRYISTAA